VKGCLPLAEGFFNQRVRLAHAQDLSRFEDRLPQTSCNEVRGQALATAAEDLDMECQ
jgi:hypothetical protein